MIYITQLIYHKKGKKKVFERFEKSVLPLILRHGGQLLFRFAPASGSIRSASIEKPDEIQLIRFESEEQFRAYVEDEDRKVLLALKQESVRTQILIKGEPI
ncbi:MAG: DUF1330 domain-containing protein [Chitinophagaceae bacterium]|nr:DUF1330 domain-containing protein [Chitinophagaceae bacterium]